MTAGGEGVRPGHHVLDRVALHLPTAVRAVGAAYAGEEQFQVVVHLGGGAHRAPGIARHHLLFDGDGRADAGDAVHIRFFQPAHELAGIAAQAFHIAALALGVEGVEGQRAFPAAAQAGDHHEFPPGDLHRDVLQVVDAGTLNADDTFQRAAEGFLRTRGGRLGGLGGGWSGQGGCGAARERRETGARN